MDGPEHVFADRSLWAKFGSAEHRAVAREAVRKSLVLLKNENQTLPLAKDLGRIHVAGLHADNLAIRRVAGRSTGRAEAATSPKAPRSWKPSGRRWRPVPR